MVLIAPWGGRKMRESAPSLRLRDASPATGYHSFFPIPIPLPTTPFRPEHGYELSGCVHLYLPFFAAGIWRENRQAGSAARHPGAFRVTFLTHRDLFLICQLCWTGILCRTRCSDYYSCVESSSPWSRFIQMSPVLGASGFVYTFSLSSFTLPWLVVYGSIAASLP